MKERSGPPDRKGFLTRRTVVRGAAWTIPVIATATATPRAAASVPCAGSTLTLDSVQFRRDSAQGWNGRLTTDGAQTSTPVIMTGTDDGAVMFAHYRFSNPTDCHFSGPVRVQFDLPSHLVRAVPRASGWTSSTGEQYTQNGRSYRRYYADGTVSLAPGATGVVRLDWSIQTSTYLRRADVWGESWTESTWTGALGYVQGWTIEYTGARAYLQNDGTTLNAAPDNGLGTRRFFVGIGTRRP
ncbi:MULTISPECIES: hypothetical protein [Bacteria]|uniref:hypothetical protein n=1 Tax=Bacteria TaxID=2 RepID=UPI003C7D0EFD